MVASAYRGGAFSSEDSRYKKYTFDEMKDADLNKTTQGGWVAMLQHYFVSAWAPNANDTNSFYSRVIPGKDQAIIGYKAPLVDVAAGQQAEVSGKLWIGPQAAGSDGQGGKPPGSDRRLRLALVHRPTAALAADRVPRFRPELGSGHHHADPAGARHHVPR